MKNVKRTIFIILFILILIILIFSIIILTNRNFRFIGHDYKTFDTLVVDSNYDVNLKNIVVKFDASELEIKENSENKIGIKIYGDKDKVKLSSDSNKIIVETLNKKCTFFCYNVKIPKVYIYIPSNYSGNIDVQSNFGDVSIYSFPLLDVSINMDSGNLMIEEIKNGVINNSHGDINVTKFVNSLEVNANAGDIEVNKVLKLNAKNNFGDIKINEVEEYLDISNDAGSIEVKTLHLEENSKIHNNLGNIKIGLTNKIKIKTSTDLGSVKVNNNYDESAIVLNINNNLGDIIVDN